MIKIGADLKIMLEPCPFCGKKDPVIRRHRADGMKLFRDRYSVLCDFREDGCGTESGWWYAPEEAAEMWNKRAGRKKA